MSELKGMLFYNMSGVVVPAIESPEIHRKVEEEIFLFKETSVVGKGLYTNEEILQIYGLFLRGGKRILLKREFQGGQGSSKAIRAWNQVQRCSQEHDEIKCRFKDKLPELSFEEAKTLISLSSKNHDQTVPLSELDCSQEIGEKLYRELYDPSVVAEAILKTEKFISLRKTHPENFTEEAEIRVLRQPYGWGGCTDHRTMFFNSFSIDRDGLKVYGEGYYTMEIDSVMLETEFLEVAKELFEKGEVSKGTLNCYGLNFK